MLCRAEVRCVSFVPPCLISSPSRANMSPLCQACERRPSSVVEPVDDPAEPYFVCEECHGRLLSRSLRPLEWFNLAKRHSWSRFLLHDDFYDNDGTASQPEEEVAAPVSLLTPSLDEASGSAESLLDYTITRWRIEDELVEKWKSLPVDEVLTVLHGRFAGTRNASVRSAVLEVGSLVGTAAAELVQQAWKVYPDRVPYWSLVQATAACLPIEAGFARAERALAEMPEKSRRENFSALAHFKSQQALSWIEKNSFEPTTEAWGRLAAASSFTWDKATEWMSSGRPLNLIAVDALLAIADPRTPFLRALRPSLGAPPDEREMQQVLEAAAAADPVPRVKQRIASLLSKLPVLAGSRPGQAGNRANERFDGAVSPREEGGEAGLYEGEDGDYGNVVRRSDWSKS